MTLSLSIDLGQTANFTVQQNKTHASNSHIIGVINDMINPPIYLKSRPSNNLFSVKILNKNNTISTIENNYVLNLHFEKIK